MILLQNLEINPRNEKSRYRRATLEQRNLLYHVFADFSRVFIAHEK